VYIRKKGSDMREITTYWRNTISKLTEQCNNEPDVNKKIELLYRINSILPKPYQLKIPSLLTDDYINTAMYRIYLTIRGNSITRN
jgi:predicted DNA-binding protein (UPF0278 family)